MRSALRGTEVIPPADGWARLERELGPHPRISVLRSHWPRIAAAAAAVLIFLEACVATANLDDYTCCMKTGI